MTEHARSSGRLARPAPPGRSGAAATRGFHLAWLAILAAAALAAWSGFGGAASAAPALALAAAPGAIGALIGRSDRRLLRWLALAVWTAAVTGGVWMTGGAVGPLAALALAPLAAGVALDGTVTIAAGASLAIASAALLVLAGAAGATPAPVPAAWLAPFSASVIGVALAALLVLKERAQAARISLVTSDDQALRQASQYHGQRLLELDADGKVVSVGGSAEGAPWGSAPPTHFADLAADPSVLVTALREARTCERLETFFAPAADPATTLAAVLARKEGGFIVILRDESARSSREAALSQTAADAQAQNEAKSRFLANMSHELRTPLNAIVGFSDIMRAQMFGPLTPKYLEYSELIHESGGHLVELVNDILDLSRIEAQRFELAKEVFDAREAVSAALRLVRVQADTAHVRLRGLLPSTPVLVEADRRALKQIVLNLLSNALKFTPAGGQTKVVLQPREARLEILVADTGVGIAAKDLERLGQPFRQAGDAQHRSLGSGLGLSLVRAFCAAHGGEMMIESELGEGTVVTIRLPVLANPAPESATNGDRSSPSPRPSTTSPHPTADLPGNVIPFSPERRAQRR
ncbi:MAG TPA: HAMP domain-containing sensor histidine kinase [Caulobacteraceae bacterium]|nr:HAMP domain-containing sensor histidine kinase [Caulobacteraceae bacterium]